MPSFKKNLSDNENSKIKHYLDKIEAIVRTRLIKPFDGIRFIFVSLGPQTVRLLIIIFAFTVFIVQLFSQYGLDTFSFIILCVGILAILEKRIRELLMNIEAVGFPGLKIPTQILNKAENSYQNIIDNYFNVSDLDMKYYDLSPKKHSAILDSLEKDIFATLKEIMSCFNISLQVDLPDIESLTQFLYIHKGINDDVTQIISHFWKLKDKKNLSDNENSKIASFGIRTLRILLAILRSLERTTKKFNGKPDEISINSTIEPQKNIIALYASVKVSDSNKNYFPIKKLSSENFSITENYNHNTYDAKITKVCPVKESEVPIHIIIALDTSSSMRTRQRLVKAKEALKVFLNYLEDTIENHSQINIAILPFGGNSQTLKDKNFIKNGNNSIWFNSFDNLASRISSLVARGCTPLWGAINMSIDTLSKEKGYKMIICISDGENTEEETSYSNVVSKIENSNIKIPIYTIGYGKEKNFPKLIELSTRSKAGELNSGSFMEVSPDKIPNLFKDISEFVTHAYGIYWEPTGAEENEEVNVKVSIKYSTDFHGIIEGTETLKYTSK